MNEPKEPLKKLDHHKDNKSLNSISNINDDEIIASNGSAANNSKDISERDTQIL